MNKMYEEIRNAIAQVEAREMDESREFRLRLHGFALLLGCEDTGYIGPVKVMCDDDGWFSSTDVYREAPEAPLEAPSWGWPGQAAQKNEKDCEGSRANVPIPLISSMKALDEFLDNEVGHRWESAMEMDRVWRNMVDLPGETIEEEGTSEQELGQMIAALDRSDPNDVRPFRLDIGDEVIEGGVGSDQDGHLECRFSCTLPVLNPLLADDFVEFWNENSGGHVAVWDGDRIVLAIGLEEPGPLDGNDLADSMRDACAKAHHYFEYLMHGFADWAGDFIVLIECPPSPASALTGEADLDA